MTTRGMYLIGMLVLLFVANLAMLMGLTNWPQRVREGFAEHAAATMGSMEPKKEEKKERLTPDSRTAVAAEGFMDYLINGFDTAPIAGDDRGYAGWEPGANLPPDAQGFRARMPNVPHRTDRVATAMLPFDANQCKPECCSSTMSCDGGGCVCTTPEDRDLINTRGGNRLDRRHLGGRHGYDEDM
jgi:hypothetical protein